MRVKKSIKNIKYNLIFYILNMFMVFYIRKLFINYIGSETTGLDALYQNLLGFLSIAELGISDAVIYSLYKPLSQKNHEKLNSIIITYKYLYRLVALVIGLVSIIVSIFIVNIVGKTSFSNSYIKTSFFIYLLIPLSTYLLSYAHVLIMANEEGYIISSIVGKIRILKNIIQIITIYYFKNYFIWLLEELLFNVISMTLINLKISRKFKWINFKKAKPFKLLMRENKEIIINTGNLFFHKISGFVVYQTDYIVLSVYTTLLTVTIYSSYIMVLNGIKGLCNQIYIGIKPSLGSLIAEGNDERSYIVWRKLFIIFILFSGIICYCTYSLINDFIRLWIGQKYVLDNLTVICIIINLFFVVIRPVNDNFKDGYGIFSDKGAPIFEALLNLIISMTLVRRLGIIGVVIGTNVSNFLIIIFWKPYIIFKSGFKKSLYHFYFVLIRGGIMIILSITISSILLNYIFSNFYVSNWFWFLIKSAITLFITCITTVCCTMVDREIRFITMTYLKRFIILIRNKYKKITYKGD